MIRLIQPFIVLVFLGLMVSCKTLPPEEMPLPPPEWQIVAGHVEDKSGCQGIGGLYHSTPEKIENSDGLWEPDEEFDWAYAYAWIFVGYADTRDFPSELIKKSESLASAVEHDQWIAIDFSNPEKFVFQYPTMPRTMVKTWAWSEAEDNFSCIDGRIQLPIDVNISGHEGPDSNHQVQTTIGLSHDGSLLVNQTVSLAKPSLLERGLPRFHVYRFPRMESS